jgi:phosphate transport system protein
MAISSSRSHLDASLQVLREDILRMGSLVEDQIRNSVKANKVRDLGLARDVVEADIRVNELRYRVERECLEVIAREQPTARDLRLIVSASHMASEIERIGDHAVGNANIAMRLGEEPLHAPLVEIERMQEIVCEMVHGALDAYVRGDIVLAQEIVLKDSQVDELYRQVLRDSLAYMQQDAKTVERATYRQWIAHNLERIGDRATNLCERVIFTMTGALGDYKAFRSRDE